MALLAGRAVWCWLFIAKTRLIKCGWYAFRFKWNSDVSIAIGAGEELGHCPCPNNEIFVKKTTQNIFLENKCKMSEKQLEQLANLYAYNLKKSQSLIGHFLLRLTKLVRKYLLIFSNINNFMKMAEIEVAPYLHGRGLSGPTKT